MGASRDFLTFFFIFLKLVERKSENNAVAAAPPCQIDDWWISAFYLSYLL